jgi:acyl carrier protein
VAANTRVLSPTQVNEFRFGYNSMFNNIATELAGVRNVNEELNTSIQVSDENSWGIPNIGIGGGLSGFGDSANGPFTIDNRIYQVVDNYSWVTGKHSLRFGGEWRYNQFKQIGNEFARTRFTTNGQFTGDPTDGLRGGYNGADFLMGAFSSIEGAVDLAKGDFRGTELAFYFDDTCKVTPNLTVNLGLRWEFAQPYLDKFGNEPNIQLNQPLPDVANVADRSLHPVLVRTGMGDYYDGLSFRYSDTTLPLARDGRLGDRMINNDWNNLAPRIGIAYSPSDKWAFRTGFGIFYSQESKNSIFDLNRAIAGRTNPQIVTSGLPLLSYENYVDSSSLPARISTGLVWGIDNDIATTYVLQYLFNISDSATPLLGRGIGLDSMEAMSLAVEIEEAFGFAVLDEDLTEELFASFGALTDYIIKQSREDNA